MGLPGGAGPTSTSMIMYFPGHNQPRAKTVLSPDFIYVDLVSLLEWMCCLEYRVDLTDHTGRKGPWNRSAIKDNNLSSRYGRKVKKS